MDLASHLGDPIAKTRYVKTMFDVVAPGYDMFTRIFSFGMDKQWKTSLVKNARRWCVAHPKVLDLACGTGDLGIGLGNLTAASLVIGVDLSLQMLAQAKARVRNNQMPVAFIACDMLSLCLPNASVDIIAMGYGLRNAGDPNVALREIARVLKPGGVLANLDFYRPVFPIWRTLFLRYLRYAGNLAGWLWHREPTTYGYLAPSISEYFSVVEFEQALLAAGFELRWCAHRLWGAISIHIATRKRED